VPYKIEMGKKVTEIFKIRWGPDYFLGLKTKFNFFVCISGVGDSTYTFDGLLIQWKLEQL